MVKSSSCCEKLGLKKGPWTPEEDHKLVSYIQHNGHGSWHALPSKAGLQRCGKSCRLRWANYLRPDIKRGKFSLPEEQTVIQLHALLGNRWSAIAAHLPKRTDNEIKNYWNTHLKKRLTRLGIDPTTHKPKNDTVNSNSKDAANLSHMAQWESARLEAEARLVKEAKLQVQNQHGSSSNKPQLTPLVLNKIPARPSIPPCLEVLKAWQNLWSSSSTSNPIPPPTTTKHNANMHSMSAMMLAIDDLESPISTLNFPADTTVFPDSNTALLPRDRGVIKEASQHIKPWGVLTQCEKGVMGDDDIMVAVEAFRSAGCDEIEKCTYVVEGLQNEDVHVSEPNENYSGVLNESTDFEEKHYWNNLLDLVDDLSLPGSPVF